MYDDDLNKDGLNTEGMNENGINENGINENEIIKPEEVAQITEDVVVSDQTPEPEGADAQPAQPDIDMNMPQNQNYPYGSQYRSSTQSGQYYTDYGQAQNGYTAGYTQPQNNTAERSSAGGAGTPNANSRRKTEKSSGSILKRGALICAAALLFGVIAGATMFGVNRAANALFPVSSDSESAPHETQISEQQTAPAVTLPSVGGSSNAAVLSDVSAVVEQAMPSVVAITNTMLIKSSGWGSGWFGFGGEQTYEVPSSGSGIIVGENDSELLIVTNNHVVEDASQLTVTFIDGTDVDATIKGTDEETDLAVIAVPLDDIPAETKSQISIAVLGDSDALKLGQGVIAIGNALGRGQSVTVGYVSALNREITVDGNTKEVIQTDAAINPGNSGGALLNASGEVIGINEAKYAGNEVEGVGYAIPVSDVKEVIDDLMNRTTKVAVAEDERGYLGVRLSSVDSSASQMYGMPEGAFIYQILDDGPAADSDLREMDIVTKCNGDKVKDASDLTELISYYKNGDTVTLTVERQENGEYVEKTVEVTLGKRPADLD